KALDALDAVIALIRRSPNTDEARAGLRDLLEIDDVQATAILDMQLRRLAALERQKIIDQLADFERVIADLKDILASPQRQRTIVSTELAEIVDKYGDDRRTEIITADGDLSNEDLIPDSDVVVTITRGGYAKRTSTDLYRVQRRGGRGVRGASLRTDDEVEHLFATTNHHWILFFTDKGRVYRAKVWQLPEAGRDARGGHVAGLLSFLPDEEIAQVLAIRDYQAYPYLLLATKRGLVKKTALQLYDSPRMAGIIAVNFRDDDDELIGAELCTADDDVLLVSRKGQAIRFGADDNQLRPMGRATSGVSGMKFREGDELLSMSIITAGMEEDQRFVFTVTDGGFAKRTKVSEYRQQGRGGLGIKAMKLNEDRGSLVGGLVVTENDEVIAIKASGQVTRSAVAEVAVKGRDTMGVKFVGVRDDDAVVVIALNPEATAEAAELAADPAGGGESAIDGSPVTALDDSALAEPGDGDANIDDSAPDGAEAEEEDSE
ncbi:MAG: DNA gyrase subunit A, partial [Propionibacteriaceae bacterium]|nr:DNA gyrase subunit A [Propionibacteriaceae bacterium]